MMASVPEPPILRTERLVLRPRDAAEAAVYRALWAERDPRVPAHRRIDSEGRPTVADIARRIREAPAGPAPGVLGVHLSDSSEVIGYCGLVARTGGPPDEPELVYELLRATHGRGYATEAAGAVAEWADSAGYPRLWAAVWDWNIASRRVLHKIGFRETGHVDAESEHGRSLRTVREQGAPRSAQNGAS